MYKLKVTFKVLWFDFWIGWFWDRKNKALYINPLPMCVFKIKKVYSSKGGVDQCTLCPVTHLGLNKEQFCTACTKQLDWEALCDDNS